uniref:Uncharacterized protein n=1 Tax=Rhizophora mucronata TaxID=61149 RepID=A0A2P2QLC0_RHIMU
MYRITRVTDVRAINITTLLFPSPNHPFHHISNNNNTNNNQKQGQKQTRFLLQRHCLTWPKRF